MSMKFFALTAVVGVAAGIAAAAAVPGKSTDGTPAASPSPAFVPTGTPAANQSSAPAATALAADARATAAKPQAALPVEPQKSSVPAPSKPAPAAPAAPASAKPAIAAQPSKDAAGNAGATKLTAAESTFFESKIRPILSANCMKCHSAAEGKAKGGLTLDTKEGWMKGGDNGTPIVPGDPAKSMFIKAISYSDADLQMPPNGKLSDREIADLTQWIKMGAPDPRSSAANAAKLTGLTDKARAHWAYQPVNKPAVPHVVNQIWVKNPIDSFVLNKLEASGFKPSPAASREVLIRRAYYDLIGLPPTPEEVRAFVNDPSPNAYEKIIDKLLASPQYGERWGRFWLDTARYSDTTGIENNNRAGDYRYAHAWTYRDYVINAFNSDKPYDRFLQEQIAADLLPDIQENDPRLAALGFITVGKRFQNANDQIDERIDTLSKATMAMTVACSRCHDHKFDPIPTADYYSLHGIFTSIVEPSDKPFIGAMPKGKDFEEYKQKLADIEVKNRDLYYKIVEDLGNEFRSKAGGYLFVAMNYRSNERDAIIDRNKVIADEKLDRNLYQGLRFGRRGEDEAVFAPLIAFSRLSKADYPARAKVLLDEIASGKISRSTINPIIVKAFKDVKPGQIKGMRDVTEVYGKLFKELDPKARAWVKANKEGKTDLKGFDDDLIEVLNVPAKVVSSAGLDTDTLRVVATGLPQQNNRMYGQFAFAEINELELTHPGAPARAMVVNDAPRARDSTILIRGEAQNRGPVVPRRFLEIIAGKDRPNYSKGSGRLELAMDISSNKNPLTARVAINRVWMRHFGQAFVRTPDDMGVQSEAPSHPELLDWLSAEFMENGWSFKKMHRLIMLSNTYQQSSDTNPLYANRDPDNRLMWRANLRRLDFEAIRDTMLMFTGKMDKSVGGKPVNLTDEPYSNRRSVYGYIDRGSVPELMQQFDFSDPTMANTKRETTIVPQQALFFMNSPMAVDVARKATSRPEFRSARDDASRIKALYEMLYQRAPKAQELQFAMEFLKASGADEDDLAASGENADAAAIAKAKAKTDARRKNTPRPPQQQRGNGRNAIRNEGEMVERRELTAWEQFAQALLFTNEVAYVQ